MIWLKANLRLVLAILLVVVVSGLVIATMYFRSLSASMEKERDEAVQQQNSAKAITTNVIAAVRLFNDITEATRSGKQKSMDESEQRIVFIREAVKDDKCAVLPVPAAAADRLRSHRNQIHSGSAGGDSVRANR